MGGLLLSMLWYGSAAAILLSLAALVRPVRGRFLRGLCAPIATRLGTRWRAAVLFASALSLLIVLAVIPPPMTSIGQAASHLDEIAPAYHYTERHALQVDAPPERVYAAVKAVTADEIRLFRTFTAIRRFGRSGPESILDPSNDRPILDVATSSGFVLLADDPPRELVVGTVVVAPPNKRLRVLTPAVFRSLDAAGFVKATMNFRIEPAAGGSRLTTETRVTGTDGTGIRRFTPYWRTILPGSWILRVTWLQAIARRAARDAGDRPPRSASGTM